jgi:hypothetical protein
VGQRYVGPAAEGLVEFGSRLGLLSLDDRAVAAWTDTANSVRPVQQDVFTATVHVSGDAADPPASSAWVWVVVGVAAALAVLSAVALAGRRRSAPGTEP